MDEQFRDAEGQYFILRGKLETQRITHEQFEDALKALMLQDARGRYWVLSPESAKWHVNENGQWIEGDPYASKIWGAAAPPARPSTLPEQRGIAALQPPRAQPPPSRAEPPAPSTSGKKSSGGCLTGCLIAIVLLIVLGVAGFFAFRSGALTPNKLLNLVGQGPAEIEVDNFRDDTIQVNVTRADPVGAGTPTPSPSGMQLKAFEVRTHRIENSGKYRVEFRSTPGNADLGSCTLTVRGGDQWQFVVLPERIAVNRANNPSNVGNDFVIQTSSLCR